MMAYGKAESIPRDQPGSGRLHGMIGELQQTLLRTLPVLIDRLSPGTFGECPVKVPLRTRTDDQPQVNKATSPFKAVEIDDLLEAVRSSAKRVRVCSEEIMDNIIVDAHQTIHNNDKMTKDILMVTQQTEGEVGELRGKIDEILKHQKSFQTTLDAVYGKNSLLSFLVEYLSKLKTNIVLGSTLYSYTLRKPRATRRREIIEDVSAPL
jgi:hypothetical protein